MCSGTVANRNKSWFTELSDKMKSTKTHLYWCMKNCTGNADDLRVMIMNISRHYQNENVQRAATSHRVYLNARRPDRQAPSRVLRPKIFNFVEHIWEAYVHLNKQCTNVVQGDEEEEGSNDDGFFVPGLEDGDFVDDNDDDNDDADDIIEDEM
ncbi:hypothetical protein EMCRGX_G027382 [Ephydatia muelleri]